MVAVSLPRVFDTLAAVSSIGHSEFNSYLVVPVVVLTVYSLLMLEKKPFIFSD